VLVVVLDTATPAVTAALVRIAPSGPAQLLAAQITVDARAHGELLGPAVAAVLARGEVRPAELTAIVAGLGPGPFTGLRVGLVTAAVLGDALGIPTYGVCSLDGIGAGSVGRVLVATDARRKEVYWAVYADGVRVLGPAVHRPAEVAAELAAAGLAPTSALGAGAVTYADALLSAESAGMTVRPDPVYPSPLALADLAADRIRSGAETETLVPLYLRRPDAVEPARPKAVRA
jgi:tRNA threonylcarbamoyl adenosine modification protein YeaZ